MTYSGFSICGGVGGCQPRCSFPVHRSIDMLRGDCAPGRYRSHPRRFPGRSRASRRSAAGTAADQNRAAVSHFSRKPASSQTTSGQLYTFGYAWNALDQLTSETCPSGRVATTNCDPALGTLTSVSAGGKNYVSGAQWAANGALSSWTMGDGLFENRMYNARFQPAQISAGNLLTLNYTYGDNTGHASSGIYMSGHDNGNVWWRRWCGRGDFQISIVFWS